VFSKLKSPAKVEFYLICYNLTLQQRSPQPGSFIFLILNYCTCACTFHSRSETQHVDKQKTATLLGTRGRSPVLSIHASSETFSCISLDCEQSLFFFSSSSPVRASSGEAARREKRGRQPEMFDGLRKKRDCS